LDGNDKFGVHGLGAEAISPKLVVEPQLKKTTAPICIEMSPGLPRLPRGEREGNERREGSSQEILPISSIERISERESETIANFLPLSFREKLREILISSRDPKKSLDQARSRAAQIFGEIDRAEGGCAPNQDQKTPAGEKEHEGINFGPINGTKSAEEKTVSSGSGGQGSPTGENSTANSRCQEDDFTGNQCQRYVYLTDLTQTMIQFIHLVSKPHFVSAPSKKLQSTLS
jgi:hypothetical protein